MEVIIWQCYCPSSLNPNTTPNLQLRGKIEEKGEKKGNDCKCRSHMFFIHHKSLLGRFKNGTEWAILQCHLELKYPLCVGHSLYTYEI